VLLRRPVAARFATALAATVPFPSADLAAHTDDGGNLSLGDKA